VEVSRRGRHRSTCADPAADGHRRPVVRGRVRLRPVRPVRAAVRRLDGGAAVLPDVEPDADAATGTPEQAAADIERLYADGATEATLRITSWDWRRQLDLLVKEVVPRLADAA
jgi:hypothetical protein